jgi:hypothetical protein
LERWRDDNERREAERERERRIAERRERRDALAIGIGGSLAAPPLPHHLAYGSVPRRFEKLR